MTPLVISAGPYVFNASLETELAPNTCAAFLEVLPFVSNFVHVRWSGEGVWMPLGDMDFVPRYRYLVGDFLVLMREDVEASWTEVRRREARWE